MPILPDNVTSALFGNGNYIFDPYKYDVVEIGGVKLPLQLTVAYRQHRNMVRTQIAGSAKDPDLSGATVKEDMGLGEATLIVEGVLMSSDPTTTQQLADSLGRGSSKEKGIGLTWVEQLKKIRGLFEKEWALPIRDNSGRFLALGIERVVLKSIRVNDNPGTDRRAYRLELIQERPLEITKLLPTEEGAGQ